MLKLEKATHDRKISISVRDKEYFLTHSFLIAFGLALGFHLLFLLIFHVAPFKLMWGDTIFPPTQVEADTLVPETALIVDVNAATKVPSGLPDAKPSLPMLSIAPTVAPQRHLEYIKEGNTLSNPFIQIERDLSYPSFSPLVKPAVPELRIVVSGPLGMQHFTQEGDSVNKLPSLVAAANPAGKVRLIFDVLVDGRTGRICWYEPKELSHIHAVDRYGESLLHELAFAPHPETFVTTGEVELHFNLGAL